MAVRGYRRFKRQGDFLVGPVITRAVASGSVQKAACPWSGDPETMWPRDWLNDPACIQRAATHLQEERSTDPDCPGCNCGFNACKTLDYLRIHTGRVWGQMFKNHVTAAVTLWGATVEYEHGYRAEYMQIDHLWLDGPVSPEKEQQAMALSMRYGVGRNYRV